MDDKERNSVAVTAVERPLVIAHDVMVRALIEGRKTQHRIPLAAQPPADYEFVGECTESTRKRDEGAVIFGHKDRRYFRENLIYMHRPYALRNGEGQFEGAFAKGWVQEAFKLLSVGGACTDCILYRATPLLCAFLEPERGKSERHWDYYSPIVPRATLGSPEWDQRARWTRASDMPRWASRVAVKIKEARLQRLQALSEAEAKAEGVEMLFGARGYVQAFAEAWDREHIARAPWVMNPWAWVLEIELA